MIVNMSAEQDERVQTLPAGVVKTEFGFRVRSTAEYVIEVHRQAFNWRVVLHVHGYECSPQVAGQERFCPTLEKGYCYFGRGLETLARAVAAAAEWDDPRNTDPAGYDKRAY